MSKPGYIKPYVACAYHLCVKRYSAIEQFGIVIGTALFATRPDIVGMFQWVAAIGLAWSLNGIVGSMAREAIMRANDGTR